MIKRLTTTMPYLFSSSMKTWSGTTLIRLALLNSLKLTSNARIHLNLLVQFGTSISTFNWKLVNSRERRRTTRKIVSSHIINMHSVSSSRLNLNFKFDWWAFKNAYPIQHFPIYQSSQNKISFDISKSKLKIYMS